MGEGAAALALASGDSDIFVRCKADDLYEEFGIKVGDGEKALLERMLQQPLTAQQELQEPPSEQQEPCSEQQDQEPPRQEPERQQQEPLDEEQQSAKEQLELPNE